MMNEHQFPNNSTFAKCTIEFPIWLTMLQDIESSPHNDIFSSPT